MFIQKKGSTNRFVEKVRFERRKKGATRDIPFIRKGTRMWRKFTKSSRGQRVLRLDTLIEL